MAKEKTFLSKAIRKLFIFVPAVFYFCSALLALAKAEAELAKKNIIAIVILVFLIAFLLMATWLGILAMLFMYFISLGWHYSLALGLVILLNVILLVIALVMLIKAKKQVLFPQTLKQLGLIK